MQFCDIPNQLLEDFPEISTLMKKDVFEDNITYRISDHYSNCIEINNSRIGIYFTVPEQYRITANDEQCKIMFADARYHDFALISMYWKYDINQWWTYKEIKEDVKKMLKFQKNVNNYISLLKYKSSIEGVKEIYVNINEL